MHRHLTAASALALMAVSTVAHAGGFQLNERSSKALGASLSGATSAASDVSFTAFNPAALSTVESTEIAGTISYVSPRAETDFGGQDIDADQAAFVPGFASGHRINDDLVIGVTTYSPFGLVTDYDDPPLTQLAATSRLTTVVIAPTVAWEPIEGVNLGASLNVMYADARLTQQALSLEGDTWDLGFSAGALFTPFERTQIGVTYHHGYDLTLEGTNTIRVPPFSGAKLDTEAEASLPAWVGIGVTQGITDDLRVMVEGRWIGWDSFDQIDITTPGAGPLTNLTEEQNYENSIFVGIGAEYDVSDRLTVRSGVAYDETPTTDDSRTLRVPDEDRVWLSAGASYDVSERITVDASYSYLHALDEAEVDITPIPGGPLEFDGGAHIFSVGGSIKF